MPGCCTLSRSVAVTRKIAPARVTWPPWPACQWNRRAINPSRRPPMRVSCICICHNKPHLTHEAIESIVNQSYPDWEAIIVDSGVLYDAGYYDKFSWRNDPRIQIVRSDETDE